MKPYRHILFILLVTMLMAPSYGQQGLEQSLAVHSSSKSRTIDLTRGKASTTATENNFSSAARAAGIPHRSMILPDEQAGYYIIAGVFEGKKNVRRFVRQLRKKGFSGGTLINPESKLHYAYLELHADWREAIAAIQGDFGGRYEATTWILELEKPAGISAPATKTHASSYSRKGIRPPNTKLLERANLYFDKMWYAEAADLYEQALRDDTPYTFEILQRAGDAHYYNTNMERAHHWYEKLYDAYKKEMGSDHLFKYAHSLKGLGKYSRAKRLMRLYNKALTRESSEGAEGAASKLAREALLKELMKESEDYHMKNLQINSRYSDFGPMFLGEDRLVFASSVDSSFFTTRRYKWNNQPYLDLYVAQLNKESQEVREAVKLSKKINSKYHEASVTFSPDRETIYFTRNNYEKKLKRDEKGINHLKIYRSVKIDGEWSQPESLPFNSDAYSTGHPALSPDGKKLYFVSDMPGSIGGTDIFVVDVLEGGQFSAPRNLGPSINTERKEMFPFVSGSTIYFSSDGHVGLGGLDIYKATLDEEGVPGEVENLGKPINSRRDDFSYIVDEATQKGYFSSNRPGGKGDDDIYAFRKILPEEINENAIAGIVSEAVAGETLPEAMISLLDEHGRTLKELTADEQGAFVFEDLESDTKYLLRVKKDDFMPFEQAISTRENERVEVAARLKRVEELMAVEDDIRKLKMDMIYFDFDKHVIRRDAASELDKLVGIMNDYPTMRIKIESHTDSRGPAAYNKYLSDKRAKATRAYLVSRGIAASRIESAIGYGEERLLNECDGTVRCKREAHQQNRRSEFIVVGM